MHASGVFAEVEFMRVSGAYGWGRVLQTSEQSESLTQGDRVLARRSESGLAVVSLDVAELLRLPDDLADERLLALPRLAHALWVWDTIELELGELATYTSGSDNDDLVALVASWRSGRDVLRLDVEATAEPTPLAVRAIDGLVPQRAIEELRQAIANVAGFTAVIFSDRPEAVEILLEATPQWSRIALATPTAGAATVDFYNNVHRKGVNLVGVPASLLALFDPSRNRCLNRYFHQAVRIMSCDHLAAQCVMNRG